MMNLTYFRILTNANTLKRTAQQDLDKDIFQETLIQEYLSSQILRTSFINQ